MLSDPTNIIGTVNEEAQICLISVAMDSLESNQEPRFLEIGAGRISEPPTRILILLYIELSNSILIGRKRTVNFRNQRR